MTYVALAVAATAIVIGGAQAIKGSRQAKEAQRTRPTFDIPKEYTQNLREATAEAKIGLPASVRERAITSMNRMSAQAYAQVGTRKGDLSRISAINQQSQDAMFNLTAADAMAMQRNRMRLREERRYMGDVKSQQWELNVYNPNREAYAEGLATKGAGMQNMFGGIGSAAGAIGGKSSSRQAAPATAPAPPPVQQGPTVGYNAPGMTDPVYTGPASTGSSYYDPNMFKAPQ